MADALWEDSVMMAGFFCFVSVSDRPLMKWDNLLFLH